MFKGLGTSINPAKKSVVSAKPSDPELLPVLTFEQLVNHPKRQDILKNIRTSVSLPAVEYEAFYLKAIIHFAEFVQQLPETAHSYYSHLGGLLDHGLERASMALSMCRSYLLPAQASPSELSPLHELWLYAIFTAALLMDVGKVATKETITLHNLDGSKIKQWLPSTGAMTSQAPYYKYTFLRENLDRLRMFYTPLLAKQILANTGLTDTPGSAFNGFDWIASDPDVLVAWLAILNEDFSGGSHLLTIIPIAQAQTIANNFAENNRDFAATHNKNFNAEPETKPENTAATDNINPKTDTVNKAAVASQIPGTKSIFQPTQVAGTSGPTVANAATNAYIAGNIASTIAPTLTAGEAFFNWLKRNINLQTWVNNPNAPIQRVNEGLFIAHPKLIQDFCRENPKYGNWQTVHNQFSLLDIAANGGNVQTYYNPNSDYKKLQQGIVVNPYLFLSSAELENIQINKNFIKIAPETLEPRIAKIEPAVKPNNTPLSGS